MENKKNIPIFYACDEGFVKFSIVSIFSLMQNASPDYTYTIYILHSGIPADQQQKALELTRDGFEIIFADVSERLHTITDVLPLRDYYSSTTYFRLFIADSSVVFSFVQDWLPGGDSNLLKRHQKPLC